MGERFSVCIGVRSYEVDSNGHVNHANYHRYGEHARSSHLAAATTPSPRTIVCAIPNVFPAPNSNRESISTWSPSRSSRRNLTEVSSRTSPRPDSTSRCSPHPAAEITCRMGLIDSTARRLVADPRERLRELATDPAVLGL